MYLHCHVPARMSEGNIALLPKTGTYSSDPKDYRPISLLNLFYKLFDKLIKMRLVSELSRCNVMSENQAGFMKGKSCMDQIFVLETALHWQELRGEQSIV